MQVRYGVFLNVEFVRKIGEGRFEKVGNETITVDSGAEESVCPLGWGDGFGMMPVREGCGMRMVNAAGDQMPHYGSRRVQFAAAGF